MFIKLTDGREVAVHFYHLDGANKRRKGERHPRRYTQVLLHFGPCRKGTTLKETGPKEVCVSESIHGLGRAHSKLDNFDKAEGRRVALTDALERAGIPRETRTEIWRGYWPQTKHKGRA